MMMSRAGELLIRAWLIVAQSLVVLAGLGVAAYLVIRPFLPNPVPPIEVHASVWSAMATWPALIGNTLLIAGVASGISLLIALPVSYALFRTDLPFRTLIALSLILLACLPVFVTSSAVMALLGFRTSLGNPFLVGFIHGWIAIPIAILQLGLGYLSVSRSLHDAALCETSPLRSWIDVDWPQIRWSVLSVIVVQLWFAGTEVTVSDMLSVRTFAEEVYMTYQLSGSTAMQSLVVAPFVLGLGLLIWFLGKAVRTKDFLSQQFSAHRKAIVCLRRMRWILAFVVMGILAVFVLVPFRSLSGFIESPADFLRLSQRLGSELLDSVVLAVVSCAVIVAITMGIAVQAMTKNGPGRLVRWSLVLLFAWPSPCLAIALIEMLNQPGALGMIYDSSAVLVLGQTLRWLPLAVLLTLPSMMLMSRETTDAARVDGCNNVTLHPYMYWPICRNWLALAGVVTMILVLGEVTISVLLSPPGFLPLSVRFFTLVHYGLQNEAATICCLMILIVLLPWGLLCLLINRSRT